MTLRTAILVLFVFAPLTLFAQPAGTAPGAKELVSYLSLVPDSIRPALGEALKDAGGNWKELALALDEAGPEGRQDVLYLINQMPHLDRLEITKAALLEHVREAESARKGAFAQAIPDSIYQEHLLTYRLDEEPCEAWRKALREYFTPMVAKADGPLGVAQAVNQWVAKNVKSAESHYFGPEQSPLMTLARKKGTLPEIAVLTTAVLRSLGIPCRMASLGGRGPEDVLGSWIEVYSAGAWAPLYPLDPGRFGKPPRTDFIPVVATTSGFKTILVTTSYTRTGKARIVLQEQGKALKRFKGFSVSVISQGAFQPLDELGALFSDQEIQTDSSGVFSCDLGGGRYLAIAGKRDPDGNPLVVMKAFAVLPGRTSDVVLDLGQNP